jgi:hypothetical protein
MHDYFDCFEFIEGEQKEHCAIKLTEPPYADITLYLGKQFQIVEAGTDNEALTFDYEVISYPPGFDMNLINPEFHTLLGWILLAILRRHFDTEMLRHSNNEPVDTEPGKDTTEMN